MAFAKNSSNKENMPLNRSDSFSKPKMDLLKTERIKIMYQVPESYKEDLEIVKLEEKVRLVTNENKELKKKMKSMKIDSELLIKHNEDLKSKVKELEEDVSQIRNNSLLLQQEFQVLING